MRQKYCFFAFCTLMIISSFFISCGNKKEFDDELVIHYFSQGGNDESLKANQEFYAQYGLEVPKYHEKEKREILNRRFFKSEEANNFIVNSIKDADFYERTSSVEGLYDCYEYIISNLKNGYLNTFFEVNKILPDLSNYFGVSEWDDLYSCTPYCNVLEENRLNLWAQNEGKETMMEISKEIFNKFLALYNGTYDTPIIKSYKSDGLTKKQIDKERYDECLEIFDILMGNDPHKKFEISNYICTDMYYLICNLPIGARKSRQYEYYKDAILQHDKNEEKDSKYYNEMKNCIEIFEKLATIDWKLCWMEGEGAITDADCDVNRVLLIEKPQDCIYNMTSSKVSEGYCYFENGKLKTFNSYWKGNDLKEQYDGTFVISTDESGQAVLTWAGLCKLFDYGSTFSYKLKFSE